MSARKSLADAMQTFDKGAVATVPESISEPTMQPENVKVARPPSRRGKRAVTGYVSQSAFTQLKVLAAERDATIQSLAEEALNDLFQKYGKPAIA